jgi:hypothetical protein
VTTIPLNTLRQADRLLHISPFSDEIPYDFRRPHRHDYFEFFLFTAGGGTHYIYFTGHPIMAGCVHVIFPSQIHLLKRTGATGFIIICRKEYMSALPKLSYAAVSKQLLCALHSPFLGISTPALTDVSVIVYPNPSSGLFSSEAQYSETLSISDI